MPSMNFMQTAQESQYITLSNQNMDYQSTKGLDIRPHRRRRQGHEPLKALELVILLMIGIYIVQGIIYALFI